jgi:hypothetical protein
VGGGGRNAPFLSNFHIFLGMDMNVTELQDVSGYCSAERERERKIRYNYYRISMDNYPPSPSVRSK